MWDCVRTSCTPIHLTEFQFVSTAGLRERLFVHFSFFYKNAGAEINQNFKNVLRAFLRLRVDYERSYFALFYFK